MEANCSDDERNKYSGRLFALLTAHLSVEPEESRF